MSQFNLVYITAGSLEEARNIGRELVTERLAACVNVLDHVTSFYWWEGNVQEDKEVVLLAKTVNEKVSKLIEKVKSLHSYDCPCITAIPIVDGNKDFLNWISTETSSPASTF